MTDTQQPIVVVAPEPKPAVVLAPDAQPPNRNHRWWAVPLTVLPILVLVTILAAGVLTAPHIGSIRRGYAIVPSDAEKVAPRVDLEDVQTYPADGHILFVTIREPSEGLPALAWFMFHKDDDISPGTHDEIFGVATPQQAQVRGQRQMIGAQQAAEYAALSKLGFPIDLKQGEVVIDSIVCLKANDAGTQCLEEAPSGAVLEPDDKLVSLDGKDIAVVDDLVKALANHKPGDKVEVKYERPGVNGVQTGTIELIASPDEPDRTIVGFRPFDTTTVGKSPFPIKLNFNGIGGPSAGLALTLTLIDELTPGELTGGHDVAVTGTIDINGNVGAIGGLAQKASAVRQVGAKYFLVPASQSPESLAAARAVVGDDVKIITVKTLDDALKVLAGLGGNGTDLGTPGESYTPPS